MKTVLVVEDEFAIALLLATMLEDAGYRVLTAANGQQALARVAEQVPDLVLSDFMMPLMDGPALVKTLRADPATRDIPVLMMSAMPEPTVRAHVDGYRAFLRKPFPEPVLLKAVAGILGD